MKPPKQIRTTTIALAVLALAVWAAPAQAQADVAGTWDMSVSTDNGITNPSMTLVQNGTSISGTYSSEALGEADVSGSVDGNEVTISFEATLQGQAIPVIYHATLGDDGKLSGSLDIADGMLTGTFTATRN